MWCREHQRSRSASCYARPACRFRRVSGRVVAADDGAPVRRVHVGLTGQTASHAGRAPMYVTRDLETDDFGRFDFANLPAGSYDIRVVPTDRFVEPASSRSATLIEGQAMELTIRLARTGAIVGHVSDEHGDGVRAARVLGSGGPNMPGFRSLTCKGRIGSS